MTTITVSRALIEQAVGLMEDSLEADRDAYTEHCRHYATDRNPHLDRWQAAIDATAQTIAALTAALAQPEPQPYDALKNAANALLHQIDIGDFVDSNGHDAKMLKAVHDLMRLLTAPPKENSNG